MGGSFAFVHAVVWGVRYLGSESYQMMQYLMQIEGGMCSCTIKTSDKVLS